MRKILSLGLVCVLLTLAFLGIGNSNFGAEASPVSELDQEYQALEKMNQELSGQISKAQKDQAKEKEEQEKLQEQMNVLQEQINNLMKQISKLEKDIENKEKEIVEKEKQIAETFELFKVRLRSSYMEGNTSELDLLLSADDFNQFLTSAEYSKRISQQTNDIIEKLANEKAELEAIKSKLQKDKESLDTAKANLREKRDTLQEVYDKSVEKSLELANTEASLIEEQDDVSAKRAEVEDEIKKLLEEQARKQAEANNSGGSAGSSGNSGGVVYPGTPSSSGFIWPTPNYSLITSPFGYRTHPITGNQTFHKGIDISGPSIRGTNVLASKSGTVLGHNPDPYGYGIYIIIDHGDGTSTLYAHLDSDYVYPGNYVQQGQAIGAVGNTGGSTGPHLHFEVRVNGTAVNPLNYVVRP